MRQAHTKTPPEFSGSLKGLENFGGVLLEQCGILVLDGNEVSIVEVFNWAEEPEEDYAISLSSYRDVLRSLMHPQRVVGFFHTHLPHHPAEPSDTDWESAAENEGMWHVIYKPDTGELIWYMG